MLSDGVGIDNREREAACPVLPILLTLLLAEALLGSGLSYIEFLAVRSRGGMPVCAGVCGLFDPLPDSEAC